MRHLVKLPILALAISLFAVLAVACSAEPQIIREEVIVEKEVIKEVPVEKVVTQIQEVVREVPVEKIVEKEVVKTVEVEKPVIVEKEVIKEVIVEIEKPVMVEVIKEVESAAAFKPVGHLKYAATSIDTPSGWPTFAPNWQTNTMVGIQESLLHGDMDRGGNLVYGPWLAESFVFADDYSYTDLTLRENAQFQYGWGTVTAEDVAWSWNAGNPIFTPEAVHDTLPTPGVGEIQAIGKYVVRVNWEPYGIKGLAPLSDHGEPIGVAPKKAFDQKGSEWMQANIIGSGPYQLDEWILGSHIKVTVRPDIDNIWEKVPFVEKWSYLNVPEEFTRIAMLETNQVQVSEIPTKDWNSLFEKGFAQLKNEKKATYNLLWQGNYWERRQPKTGDPLVRAHDESLPWVCAPGPEGDEENTDCNKLATKFRKALFMAVDREGLVKSVLQGIGDVVYSPQTTKHDAFILKHGDRWGDKYNVDQAKALFDEWKTGWEALPDKPAVADISISAWTGPAGTRVEMGEAIGAEWQKHFGIPTVLDRQPYSTMRPTKINRTANGMFSRNCCGSNPVTYDVETWHSALTAPGGYNAGTEFPQASASAMGKNNNPTKPDIVEQLTMDWLDFVYRNAFHTGIGQGETGSLYNPNEIASFSPRRARHAVNGVGPHSPEYVLPVYK